MKDLRVDGERLWRSHLEMAEIGALPGGGCGRLALTDDDRQARDLFVAWCREAGCSVTVDQVGNIIARRPGRDPDAAAIATGSHLDTQPHGGRFDGVFGVLAGLEVMRTLGDAKISTRAPLELVVWTNEEGVRFSPLTGSSVFAGKLGVAEAHALRSPEGERFDEELQRIGYLGDATPGRPWKAFLEAHIEQGPQLEAAGRVIGLVTGIQGIRWFNVDLDGQDAHAGTTPQAHRRDAVAGMATVIAALEAAASDDPDVRLTVGRIRVEPNSGATIAGRAEFNIDLRHPDPGELDRYERLIRALVNEAASRRGLKTTIEKNIDCPPVRFDARVVDTIRTASEALGQDCLELVSGAGHDAMNLADVVPTGMIFVPCAEGISHNESESAKPEHLAAGADVLLHAMGALARW